MKILIIICTLGFTLILSGHQNKETVDYKDTIIENGRHGYTFPCAAIPFGIVQLRADTKLTGWDGCFGYDYTYSIISDITPIQLCDNVVDFYIDILFMSTALKTRLNVLRDIRHLVKIHLYFRMKLFLNNKIEKVLMIYINHSSIINL